MDARVLKKVIGRMLLVGSVFLGVLLCLFTWLYLTLRSPEAMQQYLPKIQKLLKAHANIESKFSSISIHLNQHVDIKQLYIRWQDQNGGEVVLTSPHVLLRYEVASILNPSLVVDEILIQEPALKVSLSQLPEAGPEEKKTSSPPPWEALEQLLLNPPAQIQVKKILVDGGQADIHITDPKLTVQGRIDTIKLAMSGQLKPQNTRVQIDTHLRAEQPIKISLGQTMEGPQKTLSLAMKLDSQLILQSQEESGNLKIIAEPQLQFSLSQLQATLKQGASRLQLQWPQASLELSTSLVSDDSSVYQENFYENILPLSIHSRIKLEVQEIEAMIQQEDVQRTIKLEPKMELDADWRLLALSKPTPEFQGKTDLQLVLKNILIQESWAKGSSSKSIQHQIPSVHLHHRLFDDKRQLISRNYVRLNEVRSPLLKKGIGQLQLDVDFKSPIDLKQAVVDMELNLDQFKPFTLQVQLKDQKQGLQVTQDLNLQVLQAMRQYSQSLQGLGMLGDIHIQGEGQYQWQHDLSSFWEVDTTRLAEYPFQSEQTFTIKKLAKAKKKSLLDFSEILIQLNTRGNSQSISNQLDIGAPDLWFSPIAKPLPLVLKQSVKVQRDLSSLEQRTQIALDNTPLLDFTSSLTDAPQQLHWQSQLKAFIRPVLQNWLKGGRAVEGIPSLDIAHDLVVDAKHSQDSLLRGKDLDIAALGVDLKGSTLISQEKGSQAELQQLQQPIKLLSNGSFHQGRGHFRQELHLDQLAVKGLGGLSHVDFDMELQSLDSVKTTESGINLPQNIDLVVKLQGRDVELKSKNLHLANLLQQLSLSLTSHLRQGQKVEVKDLAFTLGDDFMSLLGFVEADIASKNFQTEGKIKLKLPKTLSQNPKIQSKGSMTIPWQMFLAGGRDLSIQSLLDFDKVGVQGPDFRLLGMHGGIELEERITVVDGKRFRFSELLEENPFNRVDYRAVEAFLSQKNQLKIDRIEFQNWVLGPLQSHTVIRQNMISMPSFALALFGGDLTGQFFFNTYPKSLRLGLLARFTNINPDHLVTRGKAAQQKGAEEVLSGSVNLLFDIRKRLLTGKVAMTEIGGRQLSRLLDVLDPDYEDPDLNKLRQLLALGYPERLTMVMKHGIMNMEVDIFLAGASKRQKILGIPLTAIMEDQAGQMISTMIRHYENLYPLDANDKDE